MTAVKTAAASPQARREKTKNTGRLVGVGLIFVVVIGMVLATKFVSNDDPQLEADLGFNAEFYGEENFPEIQDAVVEQAVEATILATEIEADAESATEEYGVASSGGPVFSTTFTGVLGEGKSGIYPVTVEGVSDELLIRVQTGPAINGTSLRDATGEISFGDFTNQIAYQDAGAALNEQLKIDVLSELDVSDLEGETATVTGVFTLINPSAWLVTPVNLEVS